MNGTLLKYTCEKNNRINDSPFNLRLRATDLLAFRDKLVVSWATGKKFRDKTYLGFLVANKTKKK